MRDNKGRFIKGHKAIGGYFKNGHEVPLDWREKARLASWKGDAVGYHGLHTWVTKVLGRPTQCKRPGCVYPRLGANGKLMDRPKKMTWANISRQYKRDISDWISLCVSCHGVYDRRRLGLDYLGIYETTIVP